MDILVQGGGVGNKMAMKDWKKIKDEKDEYGTTIIYKNNKTYNTLSIFDQDLDSPYATKSTPKWVVRNPNLSVNKGFDKKTQAISYAKSYMRTH